MQLTVRIIYSLIPGLYKKVSFVPPGRAWNPRKRLLYYYLLASPVVEHPEAVERIAQAYASVQELEA